jgi:hypothetical protein
MSHHLKAGQNHNIQIANKSFENVTKFRCLGMTERDQNFAPEETRRKLNLSNV